MVRQGESRTPCYVGEEVLFAHGKSRTRNRKISRRADTQQHQTEKRLQLRNLKPSAFRPYNPVKKEETTQGDSKRLQAPSPKRGSFHWLRRLSRGDAPEKRKKKKEQASFRPEAAVTNKKSVISRRKDYQKSLTEKRI